MFSFQRLSSKVLKQIKESEGAINYAVKGNLLKKHFWTFSIWKDHNSLKRFIMEDPHATAIRKFTEWAGEGSAFVEWTSPNNTIDWPKALKNLKSLLITTRNKRIISRRRSSMQQQNITFIPETEVRYEVIVPMTGNISPVFVLYLIYSTICSIFRI